MAWGTERFPLENWYFIWGYHTPGLCNPVCHFLFARNKWFRSYASLLPNQWQRKIARISQGTWWQWELEWTTDYQSKYTGRNLAAEWVIFSKNYPFKEKAKQAEDRVQVAFHTNHPRVSQGTQDNSLINLFMLQISNECIPWARLCARHWGKTFKVPGLTPLTDPWSSPTQMCYFLPSWVGKIQAWCQQNKPANQKGQVQLQKPGKLFTQMELNFLYAEFGDSSSIQL